MEKALSPKPHPLKKALKVFKLWKKVLYQTEHMNNLQDRLDYQNAIDTVKDYSKKE